MSKNNMKVQEVDVKAERRRKRIKVAILGGVSVLVLAGGAFTAWYLTPPALPTTLDEARQVANSMRYQRLSREQKQPYLDVIREQWGSLDRDQRRAMRDDEGMRDMARDAMMQMMGQRMRDFGGASYEERMALLQNMPQRPRRERPEGEQRPERPQRDPDAMRDHMSDRMANGNAQRGAYLGEWIRARRQAREQSGD